MLEQVLTDIHTADPEWNVILLRYFNPIGAHKSGLIGEDPKGILEQPASYVAQVAIGKLECIGVFGDDYDTRTELVSAITSMLLTWHAAM